MKFILTTTSCSGELLLRRLGVPILGIAACVGFISICATDSLDTQIEDALSHHIILCTGPALDRKNMLKATVDHDLSLIPYKKIFLATNDQNNLDVEFSCGEPTCELIPCLGKQLDCLNCLISTIKMAVQDFECTDDDIIIFKHEAAFINDMVLVRRAVRKLLEGYDIVTRFWTRDGYYLTGAFYVRVGAARTVFKDQPIVYSFTKDYTFCEDYFSKVIVKKFSRVYQINYYHSSWQDSELGFYHYPRYEEAPSWLWDKANYNELYK